jgi:hypothetical protein
MDSSDSGFKFTQVLAPCKEANTIFCLYTFFLLKNRSASHV